nr:myb family transcription factor EFM [Tanacetum cinerariifolium]
MMAPASELSLECKPHSYSMLLKTIGEQQLTNGHDQTQKLEEFLSRLEEERLKIDAFKRELPLCMQLLTNAMETSRQQLQTYRANQGPPERNTSSPSPTLVLPELALSSGDKDLDHEENKNSLRENNSMNKGGNDTTENQITTTTTFTGSATNSQTHRKTRRCWSPDLHRRFVNALQMLGGSQVATPKQIRELMKVDGLTNDEVKSHLQKYRLHTRRPSPSPQSAGNQTPQLVVLGGIWVPPEYATAAGAQTLYTTHPNATHTNPHYCTPQEFYAGPALGPPQQLHHHHQNAATANHHHHQLHHHSQMYKPTSQTTSQSLPESNGRGGTTTTGGNRSESIEDGKSESGGSWKAESGGETKALVLREQCGETNGSEITLKF